MAVSGATTARGGIRVGRGNTPTWTTLPGVGDFTMPDGEREEYDVTSHSSPKGEKEFVPGRIDRGMVTFTMDYVSGGAAAVTLAAIKASAEIVQLELTEDLDAEDVVVETYAAFLKSWKRNIVVNGITKAEVSFRIVGIVD